MTPARIVMAATGLLGATILTILPCGTCAQPLVDKVVGIGVDRYEQIGLFLVGDDGSIFEGNIDICFSGQDDI